MHDHIRGLSPFPGAWFELEIAGKPERIKVLNSEPASGAGEPGTVLGDNLTIACAEGAVRLTRLQRAGGKALGAADFLRGTPVASGTRVG
ncbi:Methionyl-tRNA formyltransferase [compost metagenome]